MLQCKMRMQILSIAVTALSIASNSCGLSEKEEYLHTIETEPQNFGALLKLAQIYHTEKEYFKEIDCLEKAAQLRPNDYSLSFNLGNCYVGTGQVKQAVTCYQRVVAHDSSQIQALYNIAYALKMAEEIDLAIEFYKKVLAIDADYEAAHFGLGMAYLSKGDFERAWPQHERYLKRAQKNSEKLREFLNTNSLRNKTILVRPEGGLGDTLMFIRYIRHLKDLGAKVITVVQKPLIPLLSNCPYIDTLVPTGSPIRAHDEWVTLMTLPAVFKSNPYTMPTDVPYLFANPALVEQWRKKMNTANEFKIGICWQADVFNDSSRPAVARRGLPLTQFFKLSHLKNCTFYSLQRFDGIEQLQNLPADFPLHVFDDHFDVTHGNFCDTAAVMKNLDLVITVDTAVGHLAGGLGVPVWLLLPYSTDWRWIVKSESSPWYPTMRIFKQQQPFDWDSVMTRVLQELKKIVHEDAHI